MIAAIWLNDDSVGQMEPCAPHFATTKFANQMILDQLIDMTLDMYQLDT